jgi:hypothetical protein
LEVVQKRSKRARADCRVKVTPGTGSIARERTPVGFVTIALIIVVAVWIGVAVLVMAMFKASGHADADDERYLAEARDDVSNQSPAPHCDTAVSYEQDRSMVRSSNVSPERLPIELPRRRG